ncbi:MAG: hypothetical protein KDB27_09985 [Planctomycetales bacterium]|nr:hypothetical protein [Planctomycetales bacterium]
MRDYTSIFGTLQLDRYVYAKRPRTKIEHVPVDARLGLPGKSWNIEGIQSMLALRCIHLACQWEHYANLESTSK